VPEQPNAAAEAPAPLTSRLLPVEQAELAATQAYDLRFDERGRPRRGAAWEMRPLCSWRSSSGPGSWSSSARPAHRTAPDPRATVAAFAELAAKSNFNFLDGAPHPQELAQTA
jgi:hypothetical protein